MKRFLINIALLMAMGGSAIAQDIKLPEPNRTGGMSLMEALSNRKTTREFNPNKELTQEQLSTLLWSAWGFNREDKRTVPTGKNIQEGSIYVITDKSVYKYDAKENSLIYICNEDIREYAARQDFAKQATLNIAIVSDTDKQPKDIYAGFTAGAMSQSMYLYCASEGINTVVRGNFDAELLAQKLKLADNERVLLVQTFGF
ncbi:MAG: nitroreductase family protein [Bacteroidales bacterium]